VVPSDLHTYFATAAEVAGTLLGLLFVAISLRYDAILGQAAEREGRAIATAAFTALVNALALALLALLPNINLGIPAIVLAVLCLVQTLRRHLGLIGSGIPAVRNLILSLGSYATQLVVGIILVVTTHSSASIYTLAYSLVGALAAAVLRAWELLQPSENEPSKNG
jgi:hypothetical protein